MTTSAQPFYHLRPNKFIDRHLFVSLLSELQKCFDIKRYTYIGFGSYMFDDFKAVHSAIGINKMTSIEEDAQIYKRAKFNKPFNCIKLENCTCSDYITDFIPTTPTIFWMDFCAPSELGAQFADMCTLLSKLSTGDIVRITLNANPASLGHAGEIYPQIHQSRLQEVINKIGAHVPPTATPEQLSQKNYPFLLLECIKHACTTFSTTQTILPLFSTVYADGQQMLTFTGIIVDTNDTDAIKKIKKTLKHLKHVNFLWNSPHIINVPELTLKERLTINNKLPLTERSAKAIKDRYGFAFSNDEEIIKNYLKYYKIFPNFHHVNF